MELAGRILWLLVLPAFLLGWLLGGDGQPSEKDDPKPVRSESPVPIAEEEEAVPVRVDGEGFLKVSEEMLMEARSASVTKLERLWREVKDPLFQTHLGYDLLVHALGTSLQERDPISQFQQLPTQEQRERYLERWGKEDLKAAFAAARSAEPAGQRRFLLEAALKYGAREKPELALDLVRSLKDAELRSRLAYQPASYLLNADPALGQELSKEFPESAHLFYAEIMDNLAAKNPQQALLQWEEVPPQHRGLVARSIVRGWSRQDPAAAAAWAQEHGIALPSSLYQYWLAKDPVVAVKTALEVGMEGVTRPHAIAELMSSMDAEGTEEVATWLGTMEDEAMRAKLSAGLLSGDGPPSPAVLEAARLVAEHPNGELEQMRRLVSRIADVEERRAWVQTLPPMVAREQLSWLAMDWLQDKPQEFERYVSSLPSERARNHFMDLALVRASGAEGDGLRQFAEKHQLGTPKNRGEE